LKLNGHNLHGRAVDPVADPAWPALILALKMVECGIELGRQCTAFAG
jgi:hypothetical protein